MMYGMVTISPRTYLDDVIDNYELRYAYVVYFGFYSRVFAPSIAFSVVVRKAWSRRLSIRLGAQLGHRQAEISTESALTQVTLGIPSANLPRPH